MAATTIKVSPDTRDRVNDLGTRTHQTAEQVVRAALTEYERTLFWEEYAAAAEVKNAAEEEAENALWDSATARDARRG